MRKPVVDYRKFRLSKLNTPEFSHLWLLLGWVGYFLMYLITENFIAPERCYVMHSRVDDLIPFCEIFVIPYVFWYLLIVISLLYFLLYNVQGFRQLQTFIIVTQVVAMAIYIVFPNRQDLRPETFPRDNLLTDCIGFLYHFDTDTNVCPSLHVAYSIGIASVWLKEKPVGRGWKAAIVIIVGVICASTMLIKQHSFYDFLAALPVCVLAECIAFGKSYWKPRLQKKTV